MYARENEATVSGVHQREIITVCTRGMPGHGHGLVYTRDHAGGVCTWGILAWCTPYVARGISGHDYQGGCGAGIFDQCAVCMIMVCTRCGVSAVVQVSRDGTVCRCTVCLWSWRVRCA